METVQLYQQCAEIFPLKQSFRNVEAMFAIWLVANGMDDYRLRAIVAVEKALKTSPNSDYLQRRLKELRQ